MRFDDAFANAKYIPGGSDFPGAWVRKARDFRLSIRTRAHLGLPYGPGERQWYDLYLPKATPRGLVVFLHGGYWLAFSPRDFSHLASGAVERGWACALPAHTLAPHARIAEMTVEITRALESLASSVAGPLVVTGHSAGGHLAARMACTDGIVSSSVAARITRVVPISPLADLRPLTETTMNEHLKIDGDESLRESPLLLTRRREIDIHIWVGSAERPSFLHQARSLGDAWKCPVTVESGRHHFDVIEGLESPQSALMDTLLAAPAARQRQ